MARRSWNAGNWQPGESRRTRVLVEKTDPAEQWACEAILTRAGYEVAVCRGPDAHNGAPCPLVERGECNLVMEADVVFNGFALSEPCNRDVIRAVRAHRPNMPVVVEATAREIEQHADGLLGCRLVRFPVTAAPLVAAVDDAVAEAATLPATGTPAAPPAFS